MKTLSTGCAIAILLCLFAVSAESAEIDESLLIYFMFDEVVEGTVLDISEHGNNGIIKGDPELVEGKFGMGLDLDGVGDTIEIPHNAALNLTTALTLEMWIRMAKIGGNPNQQVGIEKGLWEAGEYSLYPIYNGGTLAQFNDLPDNCDDDNVGPDIRDGEWHHMAGVWDGKTIYLYIDGAVAASMPCAGELLTNEKSVYIGSRNGVGDRFLIATVDEVRVYNRGLTEEEVNIDMETAGIISVAPAEKMAISWGEVKQGY